MYWITTEQKNLNTCECYITNGAAFTVSVQESNPLFMEVSSSSFSLALSASWHLWDLPKSSEEQLLEVTMDKNHLWLYEMNVDASVQNKQKKWPSSPWVFLMVSGL